MNDDLPPRIVLFDGICGLCNRLVQWLVRADRDRRLRYAPLQGPTGEELRGRHPEIPTGLDTMVFVDQGRIYLRSGGLLQIARYLPFPWRLLRILRWVPPVVSNAVYDLVARFRYRVFGPSEVCEIPKAEERELFLR